MHCGEPHSGLNGLLESLPAADPAGQGTAETETGETLHASFLQVVSQFHLEVGAGTARSQLEGSNSEADKPVSEFSTVLGNSQHQSF